MHLDYGDVIYDVAHSASFHQKLELFQYNSCLALTGVIREKLYQEFGWDSLQLRRWFKKLCFYKLYKNNQTSYLCNVVPQRNSAFHTRNVDKVPLFKIKHNFFNCHKV